jgi:D-alanyl-D-alanine carboxypeptidase
MPKIIIAFLILLNLLPTNNLTTKTEKAAKDKLIRKEQKEKLNNIFPVSVISAPGNAETGLAYQAGQASISIDLGSDKVISENNADKKLQIASLTKLMTTYLALKDLPTEQIVSVPKLNIHEGDSTMGILEGEKISVLSLLKGLLINSGSDSAQTLAVADSGSQEAFIEKMNTSAKALKLNNTHFANPVGWDNQNNYSSAADIANLSRILLGNNIFVEIIQKRTETVKTLGGRSINLSNTNILLAEPGFVGVKTGYTPGAGECLVSLNKKDDHQVLTVILGSADRFGQTKAFLDWIYGHFSW